MQCHPVMIWRHLSGDLDHKSSVEIFLTLRYWLKTFVTLFLMLTWKAWLVKPYRAKIYLFLSLLPITPSRYVDLVIFILRNYLLSPLLSITNNPGFWMFFFLFFFFSFLHTSVSTTLSHLHFHCCILLLIFIFRKIF